MDEKQGPPAGRNVCRVCSSRAEYDIFKPIPAYLHASPNDYLYWKKDISTLLEETTGLCIKSDDGLPKKMCALCISYLKHAATFRQQVIDNTLSLKLAQAISDGRVGLNEEGDHLASDIFQVEYEPDDKGQKIIGNLDQQGVKTEYSEKDLVFSDKRKTDTNNAVNIVLGNSGNTQRNSYCMNKLSLVDSKKNNYKNLSGAQHSDPENVVNLSGYLNLLFDRKAERPARSSKHKQKSGEGNSCDQTDSMGGDDFQTASSDDTEGMDSKDFFSYNEKSFVEDDIMSIDFIKDTNIIINIPEHVKERKCPACFRRFMFEDSYKDHMSSCLEFKFLNLVENLNRLAGFRRSKAISPHEFIRRMIFSLRATCQYLTSSCGEELSMPDLLTNGEVKSVGGQSESTGKDMTGSETDDKVDRRSEEKPKRCRSIEPDPLISLLREKADPLLLRYVSDSSGRVSRNTGSTSLCHSPRIQDTKKTNSSSNSGGSSSTTNTEQNVTIRSNPTGRKSLLNSFNQVATERINTPPKVTPPTTPPITPFNLPLGSVKMNFTARCNACDTIFESIASLEEHNLKFHNNIQKLEEHKRIIALFESDDDVIGAGAVDILSAANVSVTAKKTKSNSCDKSLKSVPALDQQKAKGSPKKKIPSPPYQRFT